MNHKMLYLLESSGYPHKRIRKDNIRKEIFKELRNQLKASDLVKGYANKYVAHSSDPFNREKIAKRLNELSLNHLESCYKAIIQVSKKIGLIIDEYIVSEVAVPQFNQFENWDKPLLTPNDKKNLHKYWDGRSKLFRSMSNTI